MFGAHPQNILSASASENTYTYLPTRTLPTKTPARSLKHKRVIQDENAKYNHSKPVGLVGKNGANNQVFRTPAIEISSKKASRAPNRATALAEITNKTPFRKAQFPQTPGITGSKPPNDHIAFDDASPRLQSSRRASSTRKKLRLPLSANKNYKTPETRGDHWDVSDVSLEASLVEHASEAEDYDDVEYGPPTAIDPSYEPPFDMPDYKEVGATLMSLFRLRTIPVDYDPVTEFDNKELLTAIENMKWEDRIELPEIPSEDVFPSLVQSEISPIARKVQTRNVSFRTRAALSDVKGETIAHPPKETRSRRVNQATNNQRPSSVTRPNPSDHTSEYKDRVVLRHTRIPSLTRAPIKAQNTTSPQHPSHRGQTRHSRIPSAIHSRDASRSKHQLPSHDTDVESLLIDNGDEIVCEEILFDV